MHTPHVAPACAALLALTACSGGADQRPDFTITFDQATVSLRSFDDVASPEAVLGLLVSPPPGPSDVVRIDQSDALFDLARLTLDDHGGGTYVAFLPVSPGVGEGAYAGTLSVRICRDAACSQGASPSQRTVPYDVRISTRLGSDVFPVFSSAVGESWDDVTGRRGQWIFELLPAPPVPPFVRVILGGGTFAVGPGSIADLGEGRFLASLPIADSIPAGRFEGYAALEVCEDPECVRPYASLHAVSPYLGIAYVVIVHHAQAGLPPIDANLVLDGAAAVGVVAGVNGAGDRTCLVPVRVGQLLEMDLGTALVTVDPGPSEVALAFVGTSGLRIDGLSGGLASADVLVRIRVADGRRLELTLRVTP